MKLEYLADGSLDCPLIRLFDFTVGEAGALLEAVVQLSEELIVYFDVRAMPGLVTVGECEMTLRLLDWDQSVIERRPRLFEWGLTADAWADVAGLIEPFTTATSGHLWLAGTPGAIQLVMTADGTW